MLANLWFKIWFILNTFRRLWDRLFFWFRFWRRIRGRFWLRGRLWSRFFFWDRIWLRSRSWLWLWCSFWSKCYCIRISTSILSDKATGFFKASSFYLGY